MCPPVSCSLSHFSPRACLVSRQLVTSRFLNVSSLSCLSESCGREAAVSPWAAGRRYAGLPSGAVFSHHRPQSGPAGSHTRPAQDETGRGPVRVRNVAAGPILKTEAEAGSAGLQVRASRQALANFAIRSHLLCSYRFLLSLSF